MAARAEVDPSGEIMLLERFCPWQGHLADLEKEQGCDVAQAGSVRATFMHPRTLYIYCREPLRKYTGWHITDFIAEG